MKSIGVIPARWASVRFPGKVLADINGKPLIEHVWQKVKECSNLDDIIIACDDEKVRAAVEAFGAKAVMTPVDLASGTDRIAFCVKDIDTDIVVNIQGDEPMISKDIIDSLIEVLENDDKALMATVVKKISDQNQIDDPNIVKAVIDKDNNALYFSRSPIPYVRDKKDHDTSVFYKHLGIYAYKKEFLLKYISMEQSPLEKLEKLEQLRAIENGYKIKVVQTDIDTIGVDTPEDLEKVRKHLS